MDQNFVYGRLNAEFLIVIQEKSECQSCHRPACVLGLVTVQVEFEAFQIGPL